MQSVVNSRALFVCVGLMHAVLGGCGDGSGGADTRDDAGSADRGQPLPGSPDATGVVPDGFSQEELLDSVGRLRLLPHAITWQGDHLIVVGLCAGDMCAARFTQDGALDPAFGIEGVARIDGGGVANANALFSE